MDIPMPNKKKAAAPAVAPQQKAPQRGRPKSDLFTTRVTLHFSKTADRQMVELLSSMGTRERSVFVQGLVTKAQLLSSGFAAASASPAPSALEPTVAVTSAAASTSTVLAASYDPFWST